MEISNTTNEHQLSYSNSDNENITINSYNKTNKDCNDGDKIPQLSKRIQFQQNVQQSVRNRVETLQQRLKREWDILSNRKGLMKSNL